VKKLYVGNFRLSATEDTSPPLHEVFSQSWVNPSASHLIRDRLTGANHVVSLSSKFPTMKKGRSRGQFSLQGQNFGGPQTWWSTKLVRRSRAAAARGLGVGGFGGAAAHMVAAGAAAVRGRPRRRSWRPGRWVVTRISRHRW